MLPSALNPLLHLFAHTLHPFIMICFVLEQIIPAKAQVGEDVINNAQRHQSQQWQPGMAYEQGREHGGIAYATA